MNEAPAWRIVLGILIGIGILWGLVELVQLTN